MCIGVYHIIYHSEIYVIYYFYVVVRKINYYGGMSEDHYLNNGCLTIHVSEPN